jgi:hypothetical protein
MDVPFRCFIQRNRNVAPIYTSLPPNLEELRIRDLGALGEDFSATWLSERILEFVDHKEEWFPSLRSVKLWVSDYTWENFSKRPVLQARATFEKLYVMCSIFLTLLSTASGRLYRG